MERCHLLLDAIFKNMDFFWSNIVDCSALLVAEHHVEHHFLRSRAHGGRCGLTRSVLLGLLLGLQRASTQQTHAEKNKQPFHGSDLRKRLRCKCIAYLRYSKNDFFRAFRPTFDSRRQFPAWLRLNLASVVPRPGSLMWLW